MTEEIQPQSVLPQIYLTVCGGKITDPENYPASEYKGETVYFCTKACLRVFKQNPDGFINGEVEHPLEDE